MTQITQTISDRDSDPMLRLDHSGTALDGTVWLVIEAVDKHSVKIAEEHDTIKMACDSACAASALRRVVVRVAQATFTPTGNPGESRLVELAWMPGRYVNGAFVPPKGAAQA